MTDDELRSRLIRIERLLWAVAGAEIQEIEMADANQEALERLQGNVDTLVAEIPHAAQEFTELANQIKAITPGTPVTAEQLDALSSKLSGGLEALKAGETAGHAADAPPAEEPPAEEPPAEEEAPPVE